MPQPLLIPAMFNATSKISAVWPTSTQISDSESNGEETDSPDSGHDSSFESDSEELELLKSDRNNRIDSEYHQLRTAPVFTRDALQLGMRSIFPQRGLLGCTITIGNNADGISQDNRLYINTNAPFSAVVCGVQGSGKSHTTSVLLESMLIPGLPKVGSLKTALSGLVLHFGEGGVGSQPSEAAWLACPIDNTYAPPRVVVYVSSSSLQTMRKIYTAVSPNIVVEPLLFRKSELDSQAFLSLMAVNGSSGSAPLYMQTILSILRELGENYTFEKFMSELSIRKRDLLPTQEQALKQRMDLLESFLEKERSKLGASPRFAPGQLTIIDLTDPFIDPSSACGYFEILTRLFVRAKIDSGKVLVVDEAHKYLGVNKGICGLTKELLSLVRQLRHQGTRVIISTQGPVDASQSSGRRKLTQNLNIEPTVIPPVLIDLCGVLILHRFSSPSWLEHVAKHVSAKMGTDEALDRIVHLQTGQAILLAPSGLGVTSIGENLEPVVGQLGRRWVLVKTRRRVTRDGGASILSVQP